VRAVLPAGARERVRAYRSGYFDKPGFVPDPGEAVTVQDVAAADDLESSLTAMRRQMIQTGSADVAVIVGGRTAEGGTHTPGVEEELALAREAGIPVVAVASPGGQAAVIVRRERHGQPPWANFGNGLSPEINDLIAVDDDYAEVARIIWDRFGSAAT